jgi:mRNA interferase MazF
MATPQRAELWLADFDRAEGQDPNQGRPVLVVSVDPFNESPAGQIVVAPLSPRDAGTPFSVALSPPDGGVTVRSWIRCDGVRSMSRDRLFQRLGAAPRATMDQVEARLRVLLGL